MAEETTTPTTIPFCKYCKKCTCICGKSPYVKVENITIPNQVNYPNNNTTKTTEEQYEVTITSRKVVGGAPRSDEKRVVKHVTVITKFKDLGHETKEKKDDEEFEEKQK